MIEKYLEVCNLLDCLGHFHPNLDAIQKIIQQPDFRYEAYEFSNMLTNTFLASSYWLDRELFDESCLYKKTSQTTSPHLKLLDIGCTLIDKGFPLEYDSRKYEENGVNQLAPYVKTFVEQCHKRHAFLNKSKRKTKLILPIQKVRN